MSSSATERFLTHRSWFLGLVLLIITFVAYQPVQHYGFIWDDDAHVTENLNLHSLHGLYQIWFEPSSDPQYYPLQLTIYWIEYHLWGLQPFGYHFVNVLLHALNALLLWKTLQRLEVKGAWLAALIFAVHPVQVESVAWISELKNLLSTTFYLAALLAYIEFRPLSGKVQTVSRRWGYWVLAIALFLCALLSKTTACTLPAVLLVLIWWKRRSVEKADLQALSPMFVLGLTLGVMTAWLEKNHVGASGAEWSLSFLERCLLAGRALWFYAGKLLWPSPLIFIYPRWEIDPKVWWQYLFPAAAIVTLVWLWSLQKRIGREPLVAVLCYTISLAPALGFFNVYPFRFSYVADHFQYLASMALISLAVGSAAAICGRAGVCGRNLGSLAAAIVLLMLGGTTWRQSHIYQSPETLWSDTLAKNRRCWLARDNLGDALLRAGNIQEAVGQYEQALRIKPDYPEAHNALGLALDRLGRMQEAIEHFEQALRAEPNYAAAHNSLAIALYQQAREQEAIEHWKQALRIQPDYAEVYCNLGIAMERAGELHEAIEYYQQALKLQPNLQSASEALARLRATQ